MVGARLIEVLNQRGYSPRGYVVMSEACLGEQGCWDRRRGAGGDGWWVEGLQGTGQPAPKCKGTEAKKPSIKKLDSS